MELALISMRPKIGDKKANMRAMKKYIVQTQADIYVFGELSLVGYGCKDELHSLAEPVNGSSIAFMKKLAKDRKSYIIFGMPLKDSIVEELIYNAAVLVHPNGKVDIYRKWFLPTFGPFEEKIFFDEGETLPIFNTKFGKIGILICYDLFFPELCRTYSFQGANIIICISATPTPNRKYFESLLPARAIENTIFMVYVNLVGTQEDLAFWGGSQIYDPLGNLLVKSPYFKEHVTTCEIDLKQITVARTNRPVLRDIRSEIYLDLYQISRTHGKKEESNKNFQKVFTR